MGTKRRAAYSILTTMLIMTAGCFREGDATDLLPELATVRLCIEEDMFRSGMPDEDRICNMNIAVFDSEGDLHYSCYDDSGGHEIEMSLPSGRVFDFYVCANSGSPVSVERVEEMENLTFAMASPDDCSNGMIMSGVAEGVCIGKDTVIVLGLERLMAKISLRMDRSRLSPDTGIKVRSVRIGNCPRIATIFSPNSVESGTECFDEGFTVEDTERLDTDASDGMSEEVHLYMLENISDSSSVFSSYIEMEMEYRSDSLYTTDRYLIYRFRIGSGTETPDVERNCHYMITVCPEDDGLTDDGWKVEKEGLHAFVREIVLSRQSLTLTYKGQQEAVLAEIYPSHAFMKDLLWESTDEQTAIVSDDGVITATGEGRCSVFCRSTDGSGTEAECVILSEFAPPRFVQHPSDGLIRGKIGESFHLWCDIFPPDTPFDIGEDYLEDDRKDGIYEYLIDDDGHGVTITLTGEGSGMIFMEAGPPVNETALYFIVVDRITAP